QQEARLRKVRYYNGEYYDSVKYGVLRSEWSERN
nr:GNAT family N-acetyltransferase [Vibrio parahaemolyticus]MCX4136492.1 GNAT family N-acetyltransferase [Vibrio parahaemolyticus]MCZ6386917.1 GNAT family N-acetyltransferase [Vibrio parahaemolyticus]MCZ6386980.1 GNAT family N-acetyltransferase [Vibrio parahaemolyticus]